LFSIRVTILKNLRGPVNSGQESRGFPTNSPDSTTIAFVVVERRERPVRIRCRGGYGEDTGDWFLLSIRFYEPLPIQIEMSDVQHSGELILRTSIERTGGRIVWQAGEPTSMARRSILQELADEWCFQNRKDAVPAEA
jgi:hypothetical protein